MSNTYVSTFDVTDQPADLVDHITERIVLAAGVLDTLKPEWRSLVDLSNVDMGSHRYCILGQIFGEFNEGMRQFKAQANANGVGYNSYGVTEYFGFGSGYHDVNGREYYVSPELLVHLWSEQVNGEPLTMRDRLLMGARSAVQRFEGAATNAEKIRAELVIEFERVQADFTERIAKATKRAEMTAVTAGEARTEFNALVFDSAEQAGTNDVS